MTSKTTKVILQKNTSKPSNNKKPLFKTFFFWYNVNKYFTPYKNYLYLFSMTERKV